MRAKSNSPSPAQRQVQAGAPKTNFLSVSVDTFMVRGQLKDCPGEISDRPSGFAGFVVVFVGSLLFMNLAVEIARSVLGEHASSARHPSFHICVSHFGGLL
jgi:hypothetical protein